MDLNLKTTLKMLYFSATYLLHITEPGGIGL